MINPNLCKQIQNSMLSFEGTQVYITSDLRNMKKDIERIYSLFQIY